MLGRTIQFPFRLPKIEPRTPKPFVTGLATFADEHCADVFAEGLETNPRKVKYAINIFLFISRLAGKRNIPHQPVRLVKIVVIYHSHPELYERLRLNPALLRALARVLRAWQMMLSSPDGSVLWMKIVLPVDSRTARVLAPSEQIAKRSGTRLRNGPAQVPAPCPKCDQKCPKTG